MKSYSDAVPDTNKVQELEDKLTKQILEQRLHHAMVIANMKQEQDKVNANHHKHLMLTEIIIVAMVVIDVLRFGFFA